MEKVIAPLPDNQKNYEAIEKKIKDLWRDEIYLPLIRLLGEPVRTLFVNARNDDGLLEAIKTGRITFYRGAFSGRLSASISKDLKALGAQWNTKTRTWRLPQSSLSIEVRNAISASESQFRAKIAGIDKKLAQILPEEVAQKIKISKLFSDTLWKVDGQIRSTLESITIAPSLTKVWREKIADEWQNNMELWIKDWTEKEIVKLRKNLQLSIFAGNRHESAIKIIQASHGASLNKAKFLARQETRLLLTKFKETRYRDAGSEEYIWGISNHPIQPQNGPPIKGAVRHDHGVLAGKRFKWSNPPVTDKKSGRRNNPGQDFNCRCFAKPIVRFKK